MDPIQSVAVIGIVLIGLFATLMWHLTERKYARLVSYHQDIVASFENEVKYLSESRQRENNALVSQLMFLGAEPSSDGWDYRNYAVSLSERNNLRPLVKVASDLAELRRTRELTWVREQEDAEISRTRREIDDIFG
jgi:hypothetical protein